MAVSVSTLLTGRCGRNCLYLNCLGNKSLAKRSFRNVVLADSCYGSNLATPSSSVSYHECVRNHACQEGRKSGLSLIGFRKSICSCPRYMAMRVSLCPVPVAEPCLSVSLFCRCPIYMSMRVSLWAVPVVDVCLRVSLLCGCPRHMSTQVSLRPVPVAGLCGPVVTCFPVGLLSGACEQVYLSWLSLP